MELAINLDNLFDQIMIVGENRPFLSAILVLNSDVWPAFAESIGHTINENSLNSKEVKTAILKRIDELGRQFPGYAHIRRVALTLEPWTVENGLITPTLKLKRNVICDKFSNIIDELYDGH